jgi:hypothetical protein
MSYDAMKTSIVKSFLTKRYLTFITFVNNHRFTKVRKIKEVVSVQEVTKIVIVNLKGLYNEN